MRSVNKYLLRKDIAQELFEWVFFSGSSDKNYGYHKVTDGKYTSYEIPFISKHVRGFILVDSPRSIAVIAKRCDGVEFNREFKTTEDTKEFLNKNLLVI